MKWYSTSSTLGMSYKDLSSYRRHYGCPMLRDGRCQGNCQARLYQLAAVSLARNLSPTTFCLIPRGCFFSATPSFTNAKSVATSALGAGLCLAAAWKVIKKFWQPLPDRLVHPFTVLTYNLRENVGLPLYQWGFGGSEWLLTRL